MQRQEKIILTNYFHQHDFRLHFCSFLSDSRNFIGVAILFFRCDRYKSLPALSLPLLDNVQRISLGRYALLAGKKKVAITSSSTFLRGKYSFFTSYHPLTEHKKRRPKSRTKNLLAPPRKKNPTIVTHRPIKYVRFICVHTRTDPRQKYTKTRPFSVGRPVS